MFYLGYLECLMDSSSRMHCYPEAFAHTAAQKKKSCKSLSTCGLIQDGNNVETGQSPLSLEAVS